MEKPNGRLSNNICCITRNSRRKKQRSTSYARAIVTRMSQDSRLLAWCRRHRARPHSGLPSPRHSNSGTRTKSAEFSGDTFVCDVQYAGKRGIITWRWPTAKASVPRTHLVSTFRLANGLVGAYTNFSDWARWPASCMVANPAEPIRRFQRQRSRIR